MSYRQLHPTAGIMLALLIASLTGCGGGGGDTDSGSGLTGGWITISSPVATGTHTTACNDVTLGGKAFISQGYVHCCSGSATDTGVTVTWENLVTGSSGNAHQTAVYCYVFGVQEICDHTWNADIPLVLGDNMIRVTAIDPGGAGGTAQITVTKPENSWTVSGALTSDTGTGLDIYRSGVGVELRYAAGSTVLRTSGGGVNGAFALSCITNGNYLLVPTSTPFPRQFSPAWYNVSVADGNVTGLVFQSPALAAAGVLTYATSGAPVAAIPVDISDGTATFRRLTLQDGSYSYLVPPGSYTITPTPLCTGCSFVPVQRTVDLSSGDQSGLDFVYQTN